MASRTAADGVRFIEERGARFAVVPEKQYRDLLRLLNDLKDSLEMKEALGGAKDFVSLEELDKELAKAGLL